jgi:hypothetical protein
VAPLQLGEATGTCGRKQRKSSQRTSEFAGRSERRCRLLVENVCVASRDAEGCNGRGGSHRTELSTADARVFGSQPGFARFMISSLLTTPWLEALKKCDFNVMRHRGFLRLRLKRSSPFVSSSSRPSFSSSSPSLMTSLSCLVPSHSPASSPLILLLIFHHSPSSF